MLGSLPLFGVGGPDVGGVAPPAFGAPAGITFPPAELPAPALPPTPPPCADGDFIFSFMVLPFHKIWLIIQVAVAEVPEENAPTTLTLMTTTSPTAAVSLRLC